MKKSKQDRLKQASTGRSAPVASEKTPTTTDVRHQQKPERDFKASRK